MKLPPIIQKIYVNCPASEIYNTLTTARGWNSWFTSKSTVDLKNKKIKFVWKDFGVDKVSVTDGGKILEFIKNKKFIFQWKPIPNKTTVSITLKRRKKGTIVELKETGYTKIDEISAMLDVACGWGEALTLLKFYLEYNITYGPVP